ncbi:MAG: hydantoinase/oxoprolinase family protein [Anaerolineaceae bacterium]|nr:hydantoinase/oxoprolinase family protein [Anaerolineaceae bacterium]MDE0328479.1 hydantoinase/oxoprolinase family protein [Anaerolineaceae bacterium]
MRIATDIGGTFTDLVWQDEKSGAVGNTKVPTTPHDFGAAVVSAIRQSRQDARGTGFLVHGTTLVINALTERKGVRTGLITTRGFRDVLEIGRANRPDIYNMTYVKPTPFVPRRLRLEVTGRLNFRGEVLLPLCHEDVARAAGTLLAEGVEAVAVCFLHSYVNPQHELECGQILADLAPDLPVTLSHQVTREWREFERSNTAVLNSYVMPIVARYLNSLERDLNDMGIPSPSLHVMQSNGGSASFGAGRQLPVNLVESGPVAGVIGAARIGGIIGEPNVISLDVGGTTAKCSLVLDGAPRITSDYKIEHDRRSAGYPILVPTVDIVEIGAGGGSIAHLDESGALRVGPQSAGADPGPACQGVGDQPTLTDANLVAGRINPDYFLGGRIPLSVARAQQALQPLAAHFGLGIAETALGIIRIADSNMINALKLVSVRRGHDPRDFVLLPFGGGGALHGATLMRELQTRKVVIPQQPGVFSAWGMLMSDLRRDDIRTRITRVTEDAAPDLDETFADMSRRVHEALQREDVAAADIRSERHADMRYLGQEHTVKVPLAEGCIDAAAVDGLLERFHQAHEQTYTFRLDSPVELVNYHVTAFGLVPAPEIGRVCGDGLTLADAGKGRREVYFDDPVPLQADIFERDRLPVGEALAGPAVIEEPTATILVFPQQRAWRDRNGLIHIQGEDQS